MGRGKRPIGEQGSWYTIIGHKSRVGRVDHKRKTHLARCTFCGSEKWYPSDYFEKVQSCGCKRNELAGTKLKDHGEAGGRGSKKKSPEYVAWCNFLKKCRASKGKYNFHPPWADFKTWLVDVGRKPHPLYCFCLIEDSAGYFPGNVHWLLRSQQKIYDVQDVKDEYIGPPSRRTQNRAITVRAPISGGRTW